MTEIVTECEDQLSTCNTAKVAFCPPVPFANNAHNASGINDVNVNNSNNIFTARNTIVLLAFPLLFAGCGGGGGGASAPQPLAAALTIQSVKIVGTVSEDATITVEGVSAGAAASIGSVTFSLNGGSGGSNLARDPGLKGETEFYEFVVSANTDTESVDQSVHLIINPSLADVVNSASATYIAEVKHVYNRTGFGLREQDLTRFLHVSYDDMIDQILSEASADNSKQSQPAAATYPIYPYAERTLFTPAQAKEYQDKRNSGRSDLAEWWYKEMNTTDNPLLERMALFWHDHFVTSSSNLGDPKLVWDYMDVLRQNALGSFRDIVNLISRSAAMAIYLNSNTNVVGKPNENFARELMELFTLGEGSVYSETDIVEVARAFTGWGIDSYREFELHPTKHDNDPKTVLGHVIDFPGDPDQIEKDGQAVIDHILNENRAAVYICEKLWNEFIAATPNASTIASWATAFRNSDYDIKVVLKLIFTSGAFKAASERGNMFRSPIEYAVAIFRGGDVEPLKYSNMRYRCREQDQDLLAPPDVSGWPGGSEWIDTKTLMVRNKHMGYWSYNLRDGIDGHQDSRIPKRLDGVLETLWFATPVYQRSYVDDYILSSETYQRQEYVRRLLKDPAFNCK